MEPRHISLKLVLDELGISNEIGTVDDRKRVQKAIYLGQSVGVNLGYSFGWYLMGPYSSGLTKDYYGLSESIDSNDVAYESRELIGAAKAKLEKIKPLMNPPKGINLSQEDWLELVASTDFLINVRNINLSDAKAVLHEEKPLLFNFFDNAVDALTQNDLIKL